MWLVNKYPVVLFNKSLRNDDCVAVFMWYERYADTVGWMPRVAFTGRRRTCLKDIALTSNSKEAVNTLHGYARQSFTMADIDMNDAICMRIQLENQQPSHFISALRIRLNNNCSYSQSRTEIDVNRLILCTMRMCINCRYVR